MLHATVPAQTNVAIEETVRFAWNPERWCCSTRPAA